MTEPPAPRWYTLINWPALIQAVLIGFARCALMFWGGYLLRDPHVPSAVGWGFVGAGLTGSLGDKVSVERQVIKAWLSSPPAPPLVKP